MADFGFYFFHIGSIQYLYNIDGTIWYMYKNLLIQNASMLLVVKSFIILYIWFCQVSDMDS